MACEYVMGVFGYGDRPGEAIADLRRAISEHREVLERQESLSPGLQEQLARLTAADLCAEQCVTEPRATRPRLAPRRRPR